MNKKNHYINLFVLACMMVLAITSCQQELMPVQPQEDSARTLTFTLNMPQGKPAFGEGESRAATTGTWAKGDGLLMTLTAGENEDEYMILYLTLQHNASGKWDVLTDKSYMRFPKTNSSDPYSVNPMLTQETDLSLSGGTWTVRADEAWPENLPMSVQLVYAPDMEFNAEGGLALKADATTSLPEYWEAASTEHTDGTLSLQWAEPAYARLRIYTGMAGDEVKLASETISAKFTRTDHTYTATTQTDGYACFYCTTTGTAPLTSGFQVELTKVMGLDLETPATLLQATSLVPVALTAGQSYKLDAQDKSIAAVVPYAIVIDDATPDTEPNAVKEAIQAGYNAGKRIILVTGTEHFSIDIVRNAIFSLNLESGSLFLLSSNVKALPIFQTCTSLASVSFLSATSITDQAFFECTFLQSASFPAATSIGGLAFGYCTSLENASFPSVTSIGNVAFQNCTSLENAYFPVASSIGEGAFYECSALKSASFPVAKSIGNDAFNGCTSLASASFPSATSIGNYAFNGCSQLASASFPAAVSIGYGAFSGCISLENASFPFTTSIGNNAFSYCSGLKSVSFPVLTSLGDGAFSSCTSLENASFPVATSIENHAFSSCSGLKSASFPVLTSLGEDAFTDCKNLATLSFGSVITSVGNYTFRNVGDEAGGCDLHLAEGQGPIYGDMANGVWGDKQWKSITVGGVKIYPAANGN